MGGSEVLNGREGEWGDKSIMTVCVQVYDMGKLNVAGQNFASLY
jgi:hypothetical protein